MVQKHGLGRGLGALLKETPATSERPSPAPPPAAGILEIPISRVRKSRWQTRQKMDEEALNELAGSIRQRGVLVPLLVRAAGDGYELIAGERRLRASAAAGRATVPVLVMNVADRDAAETTLIENLHRADLNILEEAQGYGLLMEQFGFTQEEVADRVGKPRPTVANALRLLALPVEVREYVASGILSTGHAKLIAGLESAKEQMAFARMSIKGHLSVRNLEKAILKARRAPRKPRAKRDDVPAAHMADLSDRLHRHFGTSVLLTSCKTLANGRKLPGVIQIQYYSSEDLTRILELLGLTER